MAQHRWHKEIKAWADGAHIEYRQQYGDDTWSDWAITYYPSWHTALEHEYRVQKEPVITTLYFQLTLWQGYQSYIGLGVSPDLERWDLKVVYKDGKPIEFILPK